MKLISILLALAALTTSSVVLADPEFNEPGLDGPHGGWGHPGQPPGHPGYPPGHPPGPPGGHPGNPYPPPPYPPGNPYPPPQQNPNPAAVQVCNIIANGGYYSLASECIQHTYGYFDNNALQVCIIIADGGYYDLAANSCLPTIDNRYFVPVGTQYCIDAAQKGLYSAAITCLANLP